ncbi:MAG TPA: DoxX family protein [Candidatus Kapabacteria bacterium]|nr:DoxX family protein [Candidatus Kapabacteria bacterium]
MKKIGSLLRLEFLPASVDCGLLALRLWLGISMLLLHGWGKLMDYRGMDRFPDPLRVGHEVSWGLTVFGEVVCSILLILGLFTRFAALTGAITMTVAFFIVHRMMFKGAAPGELAFIYLGGFLAIFLAGPGRFALDGKSKSSAPKKVKPAKD